MYLGSIYMGFEQDEIDEIVYDTGSDFLVLETWDCWWCNNSYDYWDSQETYQELRDTDMQVTYGDGTSIDGVRSLDWVCLTDNVDTCVTDYVWMNI